MMKTVLCVLGMFVLLMGSGIASVATAEEQPDLIVVGIYGDFWSPPIYYYVHYCNVGSGSSDSTFSISIHNKMTGRSFQSASVFSVPPPQHCAFTGGFSCTLISNSCQDPAILAALVDSRNQVAESHEKNNSYWVHYYP